MKNFALAALFLALAQDAGKVDNPEYKGWAGQKAGAWVMFRAENASGGASSTSTLTIKLKEITPEKLIVEQTNESDLAGKKQVLTLPARSVPSKVKKGTDTEGYEIEVVAEGDEEIEIKGAKLKCHWVETKLTTQVGPMVARAWRSDTIVGGLAKLVVTVEKPAKMTMTRVAIDWKTAD